MMTEEPKTPNMSEPGDSQPEEKTPESVSDEVTQPGQDLQNEDSQQRRGTGSLLRRITGSLKRTTGSLQGSETRQQATGSDQEVEQEGDVSEPYPPEKRKSVTGQLGAIITGILRGTTAESGTAKPADRERPRAEVDEFVSELRQNLATEEATKPQKTGRTGGLFQAITSSLRRVTGSLGQTDRLAGQDESNLPDQITTPSSIEPLEAEIEQDILDGRLSTTSISEPSAWVEPEDFVIELDSVRGEDELAGSEDIYETEESSPGVLEDQIKTEPGSSEVDSISLIESGAIAALDQAEEQNRQAESGQDWMSEIRQETAEQGSESDLSRGGEKRQSATSQLLSFLTGIVRRPEKQQPSPEEADDQIIELGEGEVSDDLVSGRLDRSLGVAGAEETLKDGYAGESSQLDEDLEEQFDQVSDREKESTDQPYGSFQETAAPYTSFEETAQPAGETGEQYETFQFDQVEPYDPLKTGEPFVPHVPVEEEDQPEPLTLTPEDEQLIWGDSGTEEEEGRTIRASDFWDPMQESRDSDKDPSRTESQDAYAAQFLTGNDVLPDMGSQDLETLLHQMYEQRPERKQEPFVDIRSIVLEGVPREDWPHPVEAKEAPYEEETAAQVEEEPAASAVTPEPEEDAYAAPSRTWRTWLASLSLMQKILLVEAVAVGIALVVAIPYFVGMLLSSPSEIPTSINNLVPRSLPPGVPYPTGVTLPGGWYFALDKSTFIGGEWQPDGGEWLEGSELRRVIALPWNPQTEAVVQSFQIGDVIQVYLNNNSTVRYKVTGIERVPVDEIRIYTDLRPSLAIILYQEDSDERWVVISQR